MLLNELPLVSIQRFNIQIDCVWHCIITETPDPDESGGLGAWLQDPPLGPALMFLTQLRVPFQGLVKDRGGRSYDQPL